MRGTRCPGSVCHRTDIGIRVGGCWCDGPIRCRGGGYDENVIGTPATRGECPLEWWVMLVSAINCISLVLSMPLKSLLKQLVIEIGR